MLRMSRFSRAWRIPIAICCSFFRWVLPYPCWLLGARAVSAPKQLLAALMSLGICGDQPRIFSVPRACAQCLAQPNEFRHCQTHKRTRSLELLAPLAAPAYSTGSVLDDAFHVFVLCGCGVRLGRTMVSTQVVRSS